MNSTQHTTESDCHDLNEAIKSSEGQNEIIKIMCNRTNEERQKIKQLYITSYGEDLEKALRSKLSGNFEDCIVALLNTPSEYDAKQLHKAIAGLGTDEDTLTEIIATRPKWKIEEIKAEYEKLYNVTLETDIQGDTSGTYRQLLVALLQGGRSENPYPNEKECKKICEELYNGGEATKGTDNDLFIKYFANKSPAELAMVSQLYHKKYNKSLLDVIEKEFSGDVKVLFSTLLKALVKPAEYFATRVNKAVKGWGTNNNLLIRILVTRDEIDMPQIKKCYKELYKKDMLEDIKDDTSGDYRELLIELAGH